MQNPNQNPDGLPPTGASPQYATAFTPYGQAPYGGQPYGQNAYGQPTAYGQPAAYGQQPFPTAYGAPTLAAAGFHGGAGATPGDVETGDGKFNNTAPDGMGVDDIPNDKLLSNDLPIDIRHGFIRKVYALFGIELLITFSIALVFVLSNDAAMWLVQNSWVYWSSLVLAFVLLIVLACIPAAARSFPINLVLVAMFTACFGVLIGAMGATFETSTFLIAIGVTTGVVFSVTLFACQTKIDFTGMGGYLFVGLMVLMMMGIIGIFVRGETYNMIYASLGVLIFSFYLVFDTQLIVGGKNKKHEMSIDDYVLASIALYTDTINLFMYILMIVGSFNE